MIFFAETWSTKRVRNIPNQPQLAVSPIHNTCSYVESLETRVERLEKLLKRVGCSIVFWLLSDTFPPQLCPDEALYKELTANIENWTTDHRPADPSPIVGSAAELQPPKLPPGVITPLESLSSALRGMNNTAQTPQDMTDDDEDSSLLLADNMKRLQLEPHEYRFFGKSSGVMLIRTAIELKNEYAGRETNTSVLRNKRKEFWTMRPVRCLFFIAYMHLFFLMRPPIVGERA